MDDVKVRHVNGVICRSEQSYGSVQAAVRPVPILSAKPMQQFGSVLESCCRLGLSPLAQACLNEAPSLVVGLGVYGRVKTLQVARKAFDCSRSNCRSLRARPGCPAWHKGYGGLHEGTGTRLALIRHDVLRCPRADEFARMLPVTTHGFGFQGAQFVQAQPV